MDIQAIILHLRQNVPLFEGRVAGAADYAIGVADQSRWLATPCAYVVPEDEDAGENDTGDRTLWQEVTERFGVIVVFANDADRRGQTVAETYAPTRLAIMRALLNWFPPAAAGDVQRAKQGIYYVEGALQGFDRARLFYKWTFAQDTWLSDADGWQETLPDLEAVQITVKELDGTDPVAALFDLTET